MVATGYSNVPWLPEWPGRESFAGELVHSADYRNASPRTSGKDVLVIGAGNSGAEIAVDLVEGGERERFAPVGTGRRRTSSGGTRFGVPSQLIGDRRSAACLLVPPPQRHPVARCVA